MRTGLVTHITTAACLLVIGCGSALANLSQPRLAAREPVVLIDSRKCERPEASPYDPFNRALLRPCAVRKAYRQIEMAPGVFTVVAERTLGGVNPKAGTAEGSTPENLKIAESIIAIRKLMSEFPKSRELTAQLADSVQQLNNWMNTTKLPDEFLEATGRALLLRASQLLTAAAQGKSGMLTFTMQEELRSKISFALRQIQPKEAGAAEDSIARSLASNLGTVADNGIKTGNLGEAARRPADTLVLVGASNSPSAGRVVSGGTAAR